MPLFDRRGLNHREPREPREHKDRKGTGCIQALLLMCRDRLLHRSFQNSLRSLRSLRLNQFPLAAQTSTTIKGQQ